MHEQSNALMIKGAIVEYKLAPADESQQGEDSQHSQASSVLQSSQCGWRFKGSRARIKEVGEEAGDETEYCIEMIVSAREPDVGILETVSHFISAREFLSLNFNVKLRLSAGGQEERNHPIS